MRVNWAGVWVSLWIAGVAHLLGAGLVLALVIGFAFIQVLVLATYPLEALDSLYQRRRARRRWAARRPK